LRRTITNSAGNYSFANVDTDDFYSVRPLRANYVFSPIERSFTLMANKTDAVFTATATAVTANPLATPEFFVRQQYLDFLEREPDQGGLDYWSGQLRACSNDVACMGSRRVGVLGAFFVEQEFQQAGSFVFRIYKASLGRQPKFAEFPADRPKLICGATLEEKQQTFAEDWVAGATFKEQYPDTMDAANFVNKLFDTAELQGYAAERQQRIEAMTNSGKTRAHTTTAGWSARSSPRPNIKCASAQSSRTVTSSAIGKNKSGV